MISKNCASLIRISLFLAVGLLLFQSSSARAQTVTATVPVGTSPRAVAVNPQTNKIYVANSFSNNVTVIDGATNSTITVTTGGVPVAVAVNSATNKIYVADRGNFLKGGKGNVTVIDGATNSTTTVIDANANGPFALAVNPATNKIYIANNFSDNVTLLDGATNTTTTITDPNAAFPFAVAVNSTTNKIYVANQGSSGAPGTNHGNVTVIDGVTNSTTTVADPNVIGPNAVAVNQATNKVYVANGGNYTTNNGNVTVIDGATNSIITVTDPNALALGGTDSRGFAVAVDSTTNKIYVVNEGSHNVTVIDGANNSTVTVADLNALAPVAVVVDSATNTIYVANGGCLFLSGCSNPGSVTVINGVTNSAMTVIDPSANTPNAVAINAMTNKIYVTNLGSNNVTLIDGSTKPSDFIISVTVAGSGAGTVTSNPAGINCPSSCSASFALGTMVGLTASPASGSTFAVWSDACSGTGACNVTTTGFVTATFNSLPPPDFSLQPASASLTAQRGGQVTDVITIAPQNGSFGSAIQLACAVSGSTPTATCALSPNSVTPGANSATSTLTVNAPALTARLKPFGEGQVLGPLYAVFLPIPLALIGFGPVSGKPKERRRQLWLLCSLFLAFVALQAGCGGGSTPPPPPLNYTVTVTATSGAIQHTTQLAVSVQ
jgi:YVTN family beta-propeller protein